MKHSQLTTPLFPSSKSVYERFSVVIDDNVLSSVGIGPLKKIELSRSEQKGKQKVMVCES